MQIDLSTVIVEGLYANLPDHGMAGRTYYASDTRQIWYDTGSAWVNVTPLPLTLVALAPSAPGSFTVAHGLNATPTAVLVSMTSGGQIWLQNPTGYDATNLHLVASDGGVTGNAICFK
jgi:hypothetical protein